MRIDIDRCRRAINEIKVSGVPNSGERKKVISDAIKAILDDGETALSNRYMGVKNYSGFGDQREDHEYNRGPKHGAIVFSVGRRYIKHDGRPQAKLGMDHCYLLECVRDFGSMEVNDTRPGRTHEKRKINLIEVIERIEHAQQVSREGLEAIQSVECDIHTP